MYIYSEAVRTEVSMNIVTITWFKMAEGVNKHCINHFMPILFLYEWHMLREKIEQRSWVCRIKWIKLLIFSSVGFPWVDPHLVIMDAISVWGPFY